MVVILATKATGPEALREPMESAVLGLLAEAMALMLRQSIGLVADLTARLAHVHSTAVVEAAGALERAARVQERALAALAV